MNKITCVTVNSTKAGVYVTFNRGTNIVKRYPLGNAFGKAERFNHFVLPLLQLDSVEIFGLGVYAHYVPKLPPQQQAAESLAEVCSWFANGAPGNTDKEPTYWYDDPEDGEPDYLTACKWLVARKMAKAILKAADVDGHGGCLLCCS